MASTKISITLDERVVRKLRDVAGPGGVPAFVNEAVQGKLQAERLRIRLDDLECGHGPIPDGIREKVERFDWPA
jgi:hypothetical protein